MSRKSRGSPHLKAFLLALVLTAIEDLSAGARPASIAAGVTRLRAAGIDVIVDRTQVKDLVIIRGALPAGAVFNPSDNPAIALLVAGMLDKGTLRQDKFAVSKLLEDAGASIDFRSDNYMTEFSAHCLKQDLPLVVALLAEQLRSPAFAVVELTKFKQQITGEIQVMMDNPGARANETFRRAVYPSGHPNRVATAQEKIAGVRAATLTALKVFHAANYGPAHLRLVAVGDVDPKALKVQIERSFGGWKGGRTLPTGQKIAPSGVVSKEETVFMPDKTSTAIYLGQATGLRYRDPDALALRVATMVLGSGFTGRLKKNVRDTEGLTYGIVADVDNDMFVDGDWTISASFAPALLDKGIASTRRQVNEWYAHGVTADELAQRQSQLVGAYYVSLSTTSGLAEALLAAVQRGYDITWLDDYPNAIQGLTLGQVNAVIRKYLDPTKMVLIKAGTVGSSHITAKMID